MAYDRHQIETIVTSHLISAFADMFSQHQSLVAPLTGGHHSSDDRNISSSTGGSADGDGASPDKDDNKDGRAHIRRFVASLFEPGALELCARKVSAASSDVRSALAVCRQALQTAHADAANALKMSTAGGGASAGGGAVVGRGKDGARVKKAVVTMRHITNAVEELCSTRYEIKIYQESVR